MNESPAGPCDAVWSVVHGHPPAANAVDPYAAGIPVPDAVLTWAGRHGIDRTASPPASELRLLVTAADEAGMIAGEVAWIWHPLPDADMAVLRAALRAGDS